MGSETIGSDLSDDKSNQLIKEGFGRWKVLFPPSDGVREGSRV